MKKRTTNATTETNDKTELKKTRHPNQNTDSDSTDTMNDVERLAQRLGGGPNDTAITYLTPMKEEDDDDDDNADDNHNKINDDDNSSVSSWIIHVKQWMPTTSQQEFDRQWNLHPTDRHQLKLFGKSFTENRWSQSWGFSYSYSGSTNTSRPVEESKMVQYLIDRANEVTVGLFVVKNQQQEEESTDLAAAAVGAKYKEPPNTAETAQAAAQERETRAQATTTTMSGNVVAEGGRRRGGPYNGCLQNWYFPEDTIGLHADDERDLQAQFPIFSLTWGGTRRFVLKPRNKDIHKKVELYLEDGDLLLMGGHCQKTHRHEVPKPRVTMDPATSERINWTIRAFRE